MKNMVKVGMYVCVGGLSGGGVVNEKETKFEM